MSRSNTKLYLADPSSVADEWRAYFDALSETPAIDGSDRDDEPHAPVVSTFVDLAKRPRASQMALDDGLAIARKQVAVQSLIAAFRMVGTRKAELDPLQWTPPHAWSNSRPPIYGLSAADMSTRFSTADTLLFDEDATLRGDRRGAGTNLYAARWAPSSCIWPMPASGVGGRCGSSPRERSLRFRSRRRAGFSNA